MRSPVHLLCFPPARLRAHPPDEAHQSHDIGARPLPLLNNTPGIRGAKHCFLEAGNGNEISFVEFQEPLASKNPASFFQPWPIGMHHHTAYRCETEEQLQALRAQIKAYGTPVSKVVDHGFIKSAYFTDPSGYNLEIACTLRGYSDEEYDLTILDRRISEEENAHAESDAHGSNVARPTSGGAGQVRPAAQSKL